MVGDDCKIKMISMGLFLGRARVCKGQQFRRICRVRSQELMQSSRAVDSFGEGGRVNRR